MRDRGGGIGYSLNYLCTACVWGYAFLSVSVLPLLRPPPFLPGFSVSRSFSEAPPPPPFLPGFSVSRSFSEAPKMAEEIAAVLSEGLPVAQASSRVWSRLWTKDKRTQARRGGGGGARGQA